MLSSITLSLSEFACAECFVSLNDSGEVVIRLSADELHDLAQFLMEAPANFALIGVSVTLSLEEVVYVLESGRFSRVVFEQGQLLFVPVCPDDTLHYQALNTAAFALAARSLPGFVRLTALADGLQDQIAAGNPELASLINDEMGVAGSPDFRASSPSSLVGLTAAASRLQHVIDHMTEKALGGSSRKSVINVGSAFDCDMSELWSQVEAVSEMVVAALEADLRFVLRRMEAIVERFDLVLFSDVPRFLNLISDAQGEKGKSSFKAPTTRSIVGLDAAIRALRASGVCGTAALEARLQAIKDLLKPCVHGSVHKRSSSFEAQMTACLQSLLTK